jgi:hypothetical protein
MGKDVRFPIKIDGLDGLDQLVTGLKNVRKAADDANAAGAKPSKPRSIREVMARSGIDQMYTGGKKSSYEIDEMMGKKKGGGMDMMGMGATAGATAAGVLILVKVLKDMVMQSKIANTFLGTLNKLLGLLVDVILLPFVPILVAVLLGLTYAIMAFMSFWLKLNGGGSTGAGSTSNKAMNYLTMAAEIAGALVGAIVGALLGGGYGAIIGAAIGAIITAVLLGWAYQAGVDTGKALSLILGDWVYTAGLNFGALIVKAGKDFGAWIIDLGAQFGQWLGGIKNGFYDVVGVITGGIESVKSTWKNLVDAITGWISPLVDMFNTASQKIAQSPVTQAVNAVSQVPSNIGGAASNTALTFNTIGSDLANQVLNVLRQFGVIHNG